MKKQELKSVELSLGEEPFYEVNFSYGVLETDDVGRWSVTLNNFEPHPDSAMYISIEFGAKVGARMTVENTGQKFEGTAIIEGYSPGVGMLLSGVIPLSKL